APRIDYLAYQNNELVFVLAIEKLLGLEVPPKATWMRMLLSELNRIHSHLVWLGTAALELGAISMFWYTFREREMVLDLSGIFAGMILTCTTTAFASTCRCSRKGTPTTATGSGSKRCRRRWRSSSSASTGSSVWKESRGSRMTARSYCLHARSCTPRWSP